MHQGLDAQVAMKRAFQHLWSWKEGVNHKPNFQILASKFENLTFILKTVRELKEIGVEVRFEKENINTLSGDGELMLAVLSSSLEKFY